MAVDDDLIEYNLKQIALREIVLKGSLQNLRNTHIVQYDKKAKEVYKELNVLTVIKDDHHEIRKVNKKIPNPKRFTKPKLIKYREMLYENLKIRHDQLNLPKIVVVVVKKKEEKKKERDPEETPGPTPGFQ